MNIKKILLKTIFIFLLFQTIAFSQDNTLFAGIEIGSKGVKISVLEVLNIKKGDFIIKSYWSENAGIARGISIDGKLAQEDIDKASAIVFSNLIKIKTEFKVPEENIFIVGSSGVAMASNTSDLIAKIKSSTNKTIEFIDAQTEGRMLLKGCVPPTEYKNSMVLDIGGGNTKGGYKIGRAHV